MAIVSASCTDILIVPIENTIYFINIILSTLFISRFCPLATAAGMTSRLACCGTTAVSICAFAAILQVLFSVSFRRICFILFR